MFNQARIKLTAWYLIIIMAVSIAFSTFIYLGANKEYDRILRIEKYRSSHADPFERIIQRIQTDESTFFPPQPDTVVIEWAKIRLLQALLGVNIIILITSFLAGYFLAGRTLRPIKNMLDEQNRFITDASHELNTPLTALKTSIEVNLRNKDFNLQNAREVLLSNLEEVNDLQLLSSKLINLSKYQGKMKNNQFERIDLSKPVEKAIEKLNPLVKHKKIVIKFKSSKSIFVLGDLSSLTELFMILIDNAIKYSGENKQISIHIKAKDKRAEVLVEDMGIGINEKDLPFIFDRFYRTDKSRTKQKVLGHGLGLSIAKRIVAIHNGFISAESKLNKGTKFSVVFPIA